jgi:TPR repeat protein
MIKGFMTALLLSLSVMAFSEPSSPEEIAEWSAAARQGEAWAQSNLGQMYDRGNGVPQDSAVVIKWGQSVKARLGLGPIQSGPYVCPR